MSENGEIYRESSSEGSPENKLSHHVLFGGKVFLSQSLNKSRTVLIARSWREPLAKIGESEQQELLRYSRPYPSFCVLFSFSYGGPSSGFAVETSAVLYRMEHLLQ